MLTGIMSTITTVTKIVENLEKTSDNLDKAKDLREMARVINDIEVSGSMLKVLSKYIIEPTIIVSKTLKTEQITDKVIKLNIDIFSSFYMQVFNILTNVNNLDVSTAINILSTNSKLGLEERNNKNIILENMIDDKLSFLPIKKGVEKLVTAQEARETRASNNDNGKEFNLPSIVQREINLTVNVTSTDKRGMKKTISIIIPVMVKAHIVYVDFKTIQDMLTLNDGTKTFMERLDSYRAGAISLSDLIFATDLIKEYKANRLKDNDDIIKQMNRRRIKSNIQLLESGKAGFEKYYNCVIVNEQEKLMIENIIRGKLSKIKYKEMALERMMAMMLTVVDRDYEMLSIYTKDINANTEMTFKSLSKSKDDNNLSEIFKNMISNKPLF